MMALLLIILLIIIIYLIIKLIIKISKIRFKDIEIKSERRIAGDLGEKKAALIIENGKVTRPQFGISGVSLSGYSSYQLRYYRINTDLTDGIYVVKVSSGGAASQAGIQEGDIIVEFDGEKITTYKSFLTALYAKEPGDKVSVVINRNGSEKTVQVTLGEQ